MRRLVLIAVAVAAAAFAWTAFMPSRHTHRFRLTVEVETPNGPRSGSSVVEVERKKRADWVPAPGSRYEYRVRGEAVFVDLGGGRNLVAVLSHGDNAERVDEVISFWVEAYGRYRWDQDVWSGWTELRGAVELRPPLIPTLVTFADPLDPATVRAVRPGEFERVFGPGFCFRRATLEVVPASVPVTAGVIERRLPWLVGMRTSLAGTSTAFTNDLRERLTPLEFRRQDP